MASKGRTGWKRTFTAVRLLLTGGLLVYLVWRANPGQIWQAWQRIDIPLLGVALVLQLAGVALSAAKWGVVLGAQRQNQPFGWLFATYLAGQFASNFLPTTVGGDAVRVVQLGRRINSYSQASASIFMERLTGFLALSLFANLALLWSTFAPGPPLITTPALQWLTVGFGLVALAAMAGSFGAAFLQQLLGPRLPKAARGFAEQAAQAVHDYTPRGGRLVVVLLMSLLFQFVWILVHVACGLSLGLEVPLLLYMLMAPITDILGLAPTFVNNLGARELVFTLYLGQLGVDPATALALAFLIFTVRLVVSIVGGVVIATGGADLRAAEDIKAA